MKKQYKNIEIGEKMKKLTKILLLTIVAFSLSICGIGTTKNAFADGTKNYYTIYSDESKNTVLFLKGDEVSNGDNYLSHDNKLYEITNVDDKNKTAIAKYLRDEKLPTLGAKKKQTKSASATSVKKVGVYHTHNDESYYTPDGVDSVYGKGGVHDVGKSFVENLNKLRISTIHREDLHLPHNSGAYSRSNVTAAAILEEGVDAIFDLHRDSTKRSEYLTTVNGEKMSAVRMVVGAASANFEENQKFAYTIKGYADEVYPGLIKDIYIGKGNYNQQLSTRAMLFEMGCENIEKDLVLKTTPVLAKVVDVVLFGSDAASSESLSDVESSNALVGLVSDSSSVNSNDTLFVCLGVVGAAILVLVVTLAVSKQVRYKVGRFFSEMFAGIFGKKKIKH